MKVLTIFGTRPEIIRLSRVVENLDTFCDQVLVHTGQNYDPNLSDVFFHELGVREPDVHLGIQSGDFPEQVSKILMRTAEVLERHRPDRLLVLGDTNSGLSAIIAARMGVPVFHMEAGNRAYDNRVPEELNRRIIDHCSDVLMPYTNRSKENLLREGFERQRIYVTGNPIAEVLESFSEQIAASEILDELSLTSGEYFVVTLHRAENVDEPRRLDQLLRSLGSVANEYDKPIIVSLHPRTADKMKASGFVSPTSRLLLIKPLGFFSFVHLEKHAYCVLTDSGTVQEECCILGVPNVTLRDVTERAETIEVGSGILSGAAPDAIKRAVRISVNSGTAWTPPDEYVSKNVSSTVGKIVLGYTRPFDG